MLLFYKIISCSRLFFRILQLTIVLIALFHFLCFQISSKRYWSGGFVRTRKRVLNCYVILALLYSSEDEEEMWRNKTMALQKDAENSMKGILEIWQSFREAKNDKHTKRHEQIKFIRYMMRKEGLDNSLLSRGSEGKRAR